MSLILTAASVCEKFEDAGLKEIGLKGTCRECTIKVLLFRDTVVIVSLRLSIVSHIPHSINSAHELSKYA